MTKFCSGCAYWLATTFKSGFCPVAPGTVGSAIAILVLWLVQPIAIGLYVSIIVISFIIGVWAATEAEKAWGHDAGRINWDEVVGMAITIIALPKSPGVYFGAFLAFRFFDIVKPFPVNISQKLPRGWGVMIDDVLAAIYGNFVMQIIVRYLIKMPI